MFPLTWDTWDRLVKVIETESTVVVSGVWGGRRMRNQCLVGTEFQFQLLQLILKKSWWHGSRQNWFRHLGEMGGPYFPVMTDRRVFSQTCWMKAKMIPSKMVSPTFGWGRLLLKAWVIGKWCRLSGQNTANTFKCNIGKGMLIKSNKNIII